MKNPFINLSTVRILKVLAVVLMIGGVLYFKLQKTSGPQTTVYSETQSSSPPNQEPIEKKTLTSTPTITSNDTTGTLDVTSAGSATLFIPPLPSFMSWIPTSTPAQTIDISSSTFANTSPALTIYLNTSLSLDEKTGDPTVPAQRWTAVMNNQNGTAASTLRDQFSSYYDSILKDEGWSYTEIDLPSATIYGVDDGGDYSNSWSYLKISNGDLYMIVLGYTTSPSSLVVSPDEMSSSVCPCSTIYEVDVSAPIPFAQLGLQEPNTQ